MICRIIFSFPRKDRREVIDLENDIPMLQTIRKTTQMGCYGIETVIGETLNRNFRSALRSQQSEYEKIFREADRMLKERGAEPKDVHPVARYGSAMMSKMQVRLSGDPTAKIAALMLQGNTRGMMKSMHNIRTMGALDPRVAGLSSQLLQTEQDNIEQMKPYL